MSTLSARAGSIGAERAASGGLTALLVGAATVLVILAGSLLVLLSRPFLHRAIDASGSAAALGVSPEQARALSDLTVSELVLGPGSFDFAGPAGARFYDPSEAAHLRDARAVLYGFLGVSGAVGAAGLLALAHHRRAAWSWRAVSGAGALLSIAVVTLAVVGVLAFEAAFEVFHRIFFPGGNYTFDPSRQRLVQLYPTAFWQLVAAALGTLALAGGLGAWWAGRSLARRLGPAA